MSHSMKPPVSGKSVTSGHNTPLVRRSPGNPPAGIAAASSSLTPASALVPKMVQTLLVVDDSPENIDILGDVLRPHYIVKVATSGQQALAVVESASPPDLVLLDILMPGMSGYEVCRRIKLNDDRRNIPVMFVTSMEEQEDEAFGLSIGAADYVTKPVHPPILLARIRTQLDLKASSDSLLASTKYLQTALNNLKKSQTDLIQAEKLASLGTMVAGISHELNTPLGIALTASGTLSQHVQEMELQLHPEVCDQTNLVEDFAILRSMADLIERTVIRAATLVSGFSQVTSNHTAELRREFDLRHEVQTVIDALDLDVHDIPWTFINSVPEGICCDGPPGAFAQILTNLCQNAVRHAFVGREQGCVTLTGSVHGDRLFLSVSDDGVGIDSIFQARIFEPFYNSSIGIGGSGLGLAVARRIAQIVLGGDLKVHSQAGQGSTFVLDVPLRTPG